MHGRTILQICLLIEVNCFQSDSKLVPSGYADAPMMLSSENETLNVHGVETFIVFNFEWAGRNS